MERIPSELRLADGEEAGGGGGVAARARSHAASAAELAREALAAITLSEFLRSKPPSTIIKLTTAQTAGAALAALASARITGAPLFDAMWAPFLGRGERWLAKGGRVDSAGPG